MRLTLRGVGQRLKGLFSAGTAVPVDQELATRALRDQFLVSFPILIVMLILRLALHTGLTESANLTLIALITVNAAAVLIFRSGKVHLSGVVLTFALWAAGTFMSWTHPAVRESMAIIALFPAVMSFLILPWCPSVVLAVLSISSIVMLQLRGPGQAHPGSQTDRILALVGSILAVGDLTFVVRMSLLRSIRRLFAAKQALSKSDKELSSILQRTPDIIYRLDPEGRITFVSGAIRRYGYDPRDMLGTPVFDYLHPSDRELARNRFNQWKGGRAPDTAVEMRFLISAGGEGKAEHTAASAAQEPVFLLLADAIYEGSAESRRFVGIRGIARDITDRKRTEEALRTSEEKYSKVFHATPAGISISSLEEGRFLDVNEAFETIHGYRHDEIVGRTSFDIGLWADPREREHIVDLLKKNEPAQNLEIRVRTRGGGLRTLRYSGQLIEIAGVSCILSTVEDITDHNRLESQLQQSQKLEAVGRLAGGIAHDFNNMLTVILGRAEMASSALIPATPAHESVQEIRKAAERSAEMTRELLTFARKQDIAPRPLDLNHVISERLGMLRRLIGENIALQWNPAPDLWQVKMDPVQIDRILVNLSVNARDAIGDAGTLTISTENQHREGLPLEHEAGAGPIEWVVLTVADTGTGMSEETRAHIFEPFFTTKETGKGTGLGLATVYGTVEHSGGRIEVQSEPGRGTTFRVYLPRTDDMVIQTDDSRDDLPARGHETVLVVEDELAILTFVRTALQRQGYTVVQATSAEDALLLAASRERTLHLLLTDLILPRMSGRELSRKVTALHPGIRVILMSGYSADASPRSEHGETVPFLQKPFDMKQLSAKVREVLDGPVSLLPVDQGLR